MRGLLAAIATLAALALPTPGVAQTLMQIAERCEGKGGVGPDVRIAACTSLIRSGRYQGRVLGVIHGARGDAYADKGDFENALHDYSTAIRLDPAEYRNYYGRARVHMQLRRFGEARRDLDATIRLNPRFADAYSLRGALLHLVDRDHRRAIADFDKAIELGARRGIVFRVRGDAHDALGNYESAIDDYTRALGYNKNDGDAWIGRCVSRASRASTGLTSDLNWAIEDCNGAVGHVPESNPRLHFGLALARWKLRQIDEAVASARDALLRDPRHAPSLYLRGIIHRQASNESAAAADFLAATAIDPTVSEELRRRGVE
jgi:tetratricopeptide (TPR) repeat protein